MKFAHESANASSATATVDPRTIGIATRRQTRQGPAPSRRAASRTSAGILRNARAYSRTNSGLPPIRAGATSGTYVSVRPATLNIEKRASHTALTGTIRTTSRNPTSRRRAFGSSCTSANPAQEEETTATGTKTAATSSEFSTERPSGTSENAWR